MTEEILYTPEELAAKLKLSKYTIYEMIKRGDIQAHHIGRSIRISQTQLELYFMLTKKAENVYQGEIIKENDIKYALINGVKINVSTDLEGTVKVSVRPEDVILSTGILNCSARNMHKGKVADIIYDNNSAKILLDIGIPLLALITRQSMIEMDIKKDDYLYAIFKTMSVKVLK
ncbi:helix-turn-helix domain-containing protein [Anaerovorax odorimutans]|uniref:helix-turn-helix domain-containing protein n=1 Tax=Anaerovorax odorimutans TaxID=109327 RepID=UPI000426BBD0|nr:helix-turn-helix domain-containing protein [Anaerovorax odorimutans]